MLWNLKLLSITALSIIILYYNSYIITIKYWVKGVYNRWKVNDVSIILYN